MEMERRACSTGPESRQETLEAFWSSNFSDCAGSRLMKTLMLEKAPPASHADMPLQTSNGVNDDDITARYIGVKTVIMAA